MNRTEHFWPFRQLPSDAQGNRVLKEETGAGGTVSKRTWYVRDAAGQHLTTYEQSEIESTILMWNRKSKHMETSDGDPVQDDKQQIFGEK